MNSKFTIKVPKSVGKQIDKIPLPWKDRIRKVIDLLSGDPYLGYKLSGRHKGKRRIRVWPYRVVYFLDLKNKRAVVTEVKHRGSVSYN